MHYRLARLDAPAWGQAAAAVTSAAMYQEQCESGAQEACDQLTSEEAAKKAWLAKLDAPTWGAMAAAVTEVAAVTSSQNVSEEEAKKAWLARLDAPTWGKASAALLDVAGDAAALYQLNEDCAAGNNAACDNLTREEEAKKKWLASLDAPTWGAMSSAVTAVASAVSAAPVATGGMSAEEIAKAKWLAARDQQLNA